MLGPRSTDGIDEEGSYHKPPQRHYHPLHIYAPTVLHLSDALASEFGKVHYFHAIPFRQASILQVETNHVSQSVPRGN